MWSDDYSVNPIESLLENGAEFIINISCSPWTCGKITSDTGWFGSD